MIQHDLVAGLIGHAGLSALISTRVYADELPQGATRPALTYLTVVSVPEQAVNRTVGAWSSRFQLSLYAATAASRLSVKEQIVAALVALAGATVNIHEVTILSLADSREPVTEDYRCDIDVRIVHG